MEFLVAGMRLIARVKELGKTEYSQQCVCSLDEKTKWKSVVDGLIKERRQMNTRKLEVQRPF